MAALSDVHRKAILAMVATLPKRTDMPLISATPTAGQLSLDAALAGVELEEAPFG